MINLSKLVNRKDWEYSEGYQQHHNNEFIFAHLKKENFERIFKNFGGKPVKIRGIYNSKESELFSRDVFCYMAEELHMEVLSPSSTYYRRGYVLLANGVALGHVKTKGERTFLAWKNIENNLNEIPIIFGGMYSIPAYLFDKIEGWRIDGKGILPEKEWGYIRLDELSLKPGRLAEERSELFKLRTLRQRIREESARVESCLDSNM